MSVADLSSRNENGMQKAVLFFVFVTLAFLNRSENGNGKNGVSIYAASVAYAPLSQVFAFCPGGREGDADEEPSILCGVDDPCRCDDLFNVSDAAANDAAVGDLSDDAVDDLSRDDAVDDLSRDDAVDDLSRFD
jgi:hypothetical protein